MNEIILKNAKTGIAVLDKYISVIQTATSTVTGANLCIAMNLHEMSVSQAVRAGLFKLDNAYSAEDDGGFIKWACNQFGLNKTAIYEMIRVGKYVVKLKHSGKDYYVFKLIHDSYTVKKYNEDGTVREMDDSAYWSAMESGDHKEFTPSCAGIIVAELEKKKTALTYESAVQAYKDGLFSEWKTARELKAIMKALGAGVKVESDSASADSAEDAEDGTTTTEKKTVVTVVCTTTIEGKTAIADIPLTTFKKYIRKDADSAENAEKDGANND